METEETTIFTGGLEKMDEIKKTIQIAKQENRLAYKVMDHNFRSSNGGQFDWHPYLPTDTQPGKWLPEIQNCKLCQKGYHITDRPICWSGNLVFIVEIKEKIDMKDTKQVVSTLRLLERIHPNTPNISLYILARVHYPYLSNINLSDTDLNEADLKYADLSNADLSKADLSYANLKCANLSSANLRKINLKYADLKYANLSYANLSNADLRYANLRYVNLSNADLSYADLRYADLRYADLSSANLSYTDLSNADLRYADLSYADLRGALRDASNHQISGWTLINGKLKQESLEHEKAG